MPRAAEREEAVIRAWLEHDWPRIKKARRRGVDIVFYDEFGWSFLERLRRTWAPRGKRPIIRRVTRDRRVLTTAAGVTLSGRIFKRHFASGMKSPQVIEAVEHIYRYLPKGFIIDL